MKVFLVAGELSGDRLGGALMDGLRQLIPNVEFAGVGGPMMAEQGLESPFPMDELSVMGIAEVLPKYRHLVKRMHQTADAALEWQPDVMVTIDSPDFCLRVAREVKTKSDLRCVHYVAPSVWAWRPKRAQKMAKHVDQVLALLPFEPSYMEAAGLRCDFVGHPVVTEPVATDEEVSAFRARHNIGAAPLLLVLPGSRRGEVGRLTPTFGEVVARLVQQKPDLKVVVPAAAPVASLVKELVADWKVTPIVLDPNVVASDEAQAQKRAAFKAANVALAASGTVSLELAANDTPMVIGYDMNWLSWQIISRLLLVDTGTLVNLVAESRTVQEFMGPAFKAEDIAPAILRVLEDSAAQKEAMSLTMERLGRGQAFPGVRAAQAVLDGLKA